MKQVKRRATITLVLALFLAAGLLLFCGRWATQGRDWVSYFGNTGYFARGAIYDRNGVVLYNGDTGDYAEGSATRRAVMHLVGDRNIATSVRNVMGERLSGYHPITGTAFGSHDLYLTVDASLNVTAYEALGGKKGVVAVYNYKTGEVLCLVSAPSYDPLQIPSDVDTNSQYDGVYLNRFFSSTFTPGSIYKIITTAAAVESVSNWSSWRYSCSGRVDVNGVAITCPFVHGNDMDLRTAFAQSCNGAYAQLTLDMGGERLRAMSKDAGLLDKHEVSGVTSAAGNYTVAERGSGNLAWSGSGQYENLVNPASFLMLMGGIANNGTAVTPVLLAKETISDTQIPGSLKIIKDSQSTWSASTCQVVKEMMRNNVIETYGQDQFGSLAVCAKSGTAEVGGGNAPHSWFVGFVDDATQPLAFVVLVENGGSGASVAGSVAAKVLAEAMAAN